MIIRIVKMTIAPNKVEEFKTVFSKHMELIREFEGCKHLELLQEDNDSDNVLMTYSYWDSHEALEKYRKSELFKSVWASVKPMFSGKPLAWSLKQQFKL